MLGIHRLIKLFFNIYLFIVDLLNHLATLFSPKDFVKLLPSNGNLQFFMTFLEQSIKSQQFQEITATMMQDAAKHINQN